MKSSASPMRPTHIRPRSPSRSPTRGDRLRLGSLPTQRSEWIVVIDQRRSPAPTALRTRAAREKRRSPKVFGLESNTDVIRSNSPSQILIQIARLRAQRRGTVVLYHASCPVSKSFSPCTRTIALHGPPCSRSAAAAITPLVGRSPSVSDDDSPGGRRLHPRPMRARRLAIAIAFGLKILASAHRRYAGGPFLIPRMRSPRFTLTRRRLLVLPLLIETRSSCARAVRSRHMLSRSASPRGIQATYRRRSDWLIESRSLSRALRSSGSSA